MPAESSFKEKLAKFRRDLDASGGENGLLRTLKDMQSYVDGFPDESNRKICSAHVAKELVDWIAQKEDTILDTESGKFLITLLECFLKVCHTAQDAIRSYCVVRLYNAVITLHANSNCQRLRLRVCALMIHFPVVDEQVNLFDRMKRVVLKTVQDWTQGSESAEEGIDLLIELYRTLLVHASGKPRGTDGTRATVLALFRELFDTSMAVLYRVFTISRPKAHQLFHTIMDTMATIVQPDEAELISLMNDSVAFVETIVSFSGVDGEYGKFTKFLTIFAGITREPYATCHYLIRHQVQLQRQTNPTSVTINSLADRLRTLHAGYPSHELVMKTAIFLTCQGSAYFYRLNHDTVLTVAGAAFEFFKTLMSFVRQCPPGTVPELCRRCTSSRRHMADRLLGVLVHMCTAQWKDATENAATGGHEKPHCTVERVCELIKRKLSLLEELGCDRKRSLVDHTVRQSVTWVKYALTLLRDEPKCTDDAAQVLDVLKLLIGTQNSYRFEFLSDMHLVRLLESCYIERPECDPAQASASCWAGVSVRLLKLLLTLRDSAAATGEEEHAGAIRSIIRSVLFYQANAPEGDPIRSLGIVQLFEHPSFDRHGFAFDCAPSRGEKFTMIVNEMALSVRYKTCLSLPRASYFLELQKLGDLRENCLTFGMALYSFCEPDLEELPTETIDELRGGLVAYEPTNNQEGVKRSASLALISYHAFSLLSRASLKRKRDVPFKIEHFRNDQIDEMLAESQLDREAELLDRMESIRVHFGAMIAWLAKAHFRALWVLPSVVQIGSMLDNTARYFHLNYYPHRSVELQMLNLLLVSHGREERPLEQFAPLGFLLEQHQHTEWVIQHFPDGGPEHWSKYAGGKVGSVEKLAERACRLLDTYSVPAHRFVGEVPDNRKFQFLNLFLGLATYRASRGELDRALELIQRTLSHLPPTDEGGKADGEGQPAPSAIDTIGLLVKGRTAQIVFRLVAEYGLPWPGPDPGSVSSLPPVFTFLKLMLARFNELQKLPNMHTFMLSLATVEMSVAVLQYLIVRYDTGALVEPYADQLLKFVFRQGAGLRVMQVLLLYGFMNADMQKLNRVEVALRYLNRLLMLRPTLWVRRKEKGMEIDDPILLIEQDATNNQRHRLPSVASQACTESDVDDERKAVPKYCDGSITPARALAHSATDDESAEPSIEQYLMFDHPARCDCRYCRYPQYKAMAFQTAILTARLAALERPESPKRTERWYHSIGDHWRTAIVPALGKRSTVWFGASYRVDLVTGVARMFVQWGQFMGQRHCFAPALEAYERAFELGEGNAFNVTVDPALLEDVHFNRTTLAMAQKRFGYGQPLRYKRSRSMIERGYHEAIREGRIQAGGKSPGVCEVAALSIKLDKVVLQTPRQAPASSRDGRGRAAPKTVDRVNELIRQAASRRHQLKKNTGDELPVPTVTSGQSYSASARKPKTVNIFVDSPPSSGRTGKKVPIVPATVGKLKISSSSAARVKPTERISVVDLCADDDSEGLGLGLVGPITTPTPIGGPVDGAISQQRRRFGKRPLLLGDLSTPAAKPVKAASVTPGRGCFVADEFPILAEPSGPKVVPAATPQKQSKSAADVNGNFSSPGLNGSFRDALVLGPARKEESDSSSVIVLDDSADSRQSDEAIEASFVDKRTMSTGKHSALSLQSYSDRKRLLDGSASGTTPTARAAVAVKRRTPLLATKTKLRFDEPSPEQAEVIDHHRPAPVKENSKTTLPEVDTPTVPKGLVSTARKTTRATRPQRTNQPMNDPAKTEPRTTVQTAAVRESNIATRTRQRLKRT